MIRFDPDYSLHTFVIQNTIPQKDKLGYYDLYKCKYCKLECRKYVGSRYMWIDRWDKRITDGIERRKYPGRFRLWDWISNHMYK